VRQDGQAVIPLKNDEPALAIRPEQQRTPDERVAEIPWPIAYSFHRFVQLDRAGVLVGGEFRG
jgi:hypothetical protein